MHCLYDIRSLVPAREVQVNAGWAGFLDDVDFSLRCAIVEIPLVAKDCVDEKMRLNVE